MPVSELMSIREHVEKYAAMITTVFNMPVDIVDQNCIRIAGTGRNNQMIGSPLKSGKVFCKVLESGEAFFFDSRIHNDICKNCINKESCGEECRIYFPIKLDEKIIGAIAIGDENSDEKDNLLLNNINRFNLFLQSIADLISLKVREFKDQKLQQYNLELQNKLINFINDGVMILDDNNKVLFMNERCQSILNCNHKQMLYLQKIRQLSISDKKSEVNGKKEYTIKIRDKKLQLVGTEYAIADENGQNNKVFVFTDILMLHELIAINEKNNRCTFDCLIGESASFEKAKTDCIKAVYKNSCTLLWGEAGTGKETFARAMHNEGPRKNNKFIRIEARRSVLEDIAEKSIPGSNSQNPQKVKNELLENNTLFIDEVGNLSIANQHTLLWIIENSHLTNTKVICSTALPHRQMTLNGDFGQDLFYALEMNSIQIPPIRIRGKDVFLFIDYFLKKQNRLRGSKICLSKDVYKLMGQYSWRGNIREIGGVIASLVEQTLNDAEEITSEHLPESIIQKFSEDRTNSYNLNQIEKNAIIAALNAVDYHKESKEHIAKELGISKATLYRKMRQYGIKETHGLSIENR